MLMYLAIPTSLLMCLRSQYHPYQSIAELTQLMQQIIAGSLVETTVIAASTKPVLPTSLRARILQTREANTFSVVRTFVGLLLSVQSLALLDSTPNAI